MAEIFEELGLRPELVGAAREVGYEEPTAVQNAAIPVLRRGGNALIHAAPGSGTLGAYGLALLDRLAGMAEESAAEGAGPRALVLVPTADDASRAALSLARLGRGVGLRVAALGGGWAVPAGMAADIVVADPATAIDAVERSRLKLEGVVAMVVDGAAAIYVLGADAALETVSGLVPRDAQRVVLTAEVTKEVEDYAERHLRRALRIPPVSLEEESAPAEAPALRLDYQVVAEWEKEEAVAELLARGEPGRQRVVYTRSVPRAREVADALEIRGFATGEGEAAVVVTTELIDTPADALVVSFDPPFDAETLTRRHERGGTVLVSPRELAHLRQIASAAGFDLRLTGGAPALTTTQLAEFRDRLRTALAEEDLTAQLLILEPLFREYSPAEVAAAASALLRRRPAAPAPGAGAAAGRQEPGAALARPTAVRAVPAPGPAYVRLFMGVGARDGIVPSDLVGSITGEAQVKGSQVGRIDIRDTFSIVEVESDIATRVIQAMNGITLKGRSLRVDFDRRGSAPPARGGADRGSRRAPRERPTR